MTDLLIERETVVLVEEAARDVLLEREPRVEILTEAKQGPPGPPGPIGPSGGSAVSRIAGSTLSALLAVWEDADGLVRALDGSDEDHIDLLSGVTLTAAESGAPVNVQLAGPLDDSSWNWSPGRVFLGAGGALTQTPPTSGFDVLIGIAVAPTRIVLRLQDPIELE